MVKYVNFFDMYFDDDRSLLLYGELACLIYWICSNSVKRICEQSEPGYVLKVCFGSLAYMVAIYS